MFIQTMIVQALLQMGIVSALQQIDIILDVRDAWHALQITHILTLTMNGMRMVHAQALQMTSHADVSPSAQRLDAEQMTGDALRAPPDMFTRMIAALQIRDAIPHAHAPPQIDIILDAVLMGRGVMHAPQDTPTGMMTACVLYAMVIASARDAHLLRVQIIPVVLILLPLMDAPAAIVLDARIAITAAGYGPFVIPHADVVM